MDNSSASAGYYRGYDAHQVVQELEGLLNLAEASVHSIDKLMHALARAKASFYIACIAFYVVLVSIAGFIWGGYRSGDVISSLSITAAVCGLGIIFCLAMLWYVRVRLSYQRALKRELSVELDVRERLVSLIHEQLQRVVFEDSISAVTRAMFEIRIRRLDR